MLMARDLAADRADAEAKRRENIRMELPKNF